MVVVVAVTGFEDESSKTRFDHRVGARAEAEILWPGQKINGGRRSGTVLSSIAPINRRDVLDCRRHRSSDYEQHEDD